MDRELTRKGLRTPVSRSESSTKEGICHSSPFCVLVAPVIDQILLVPPAACVRARGVILCSCTVQHAMEGLECLGHAGNAVVTSKPVDGLKSGEVSEAMKKKQRRL